MKGHLLFDYQNLMWNIWVLCFGGWFFFGLGFWFLGGLVVGGFFLGGDGVWWCLFVLWFFSWGGGGVKKIV